MTSQEIEKGNKIVAEFMEIPPCDRCDGCGSYKFGSGIYYSPTQMEYHSNWSWLMPVVEKINDLKTWQEDRKELSMFSRITVDMELSGYDKKTRVSIFGTLTYCYNDTIPYSYKNVELQHIVKYGDNKGSLIETTYSAVLQFLEWYNSQQVK